MGGYGSGTGYRLRSKKVTVEEGLPLNIFKMRRDGLLKPDAQGWLRWHYSGTTHEVASSRYRTKGTGDGTMIYTLEYTLTRDGVKEEVTEPIEVVTTRPHFGGFRQWFLCPLTVNGKPCGRRAGKLHHPPGTKYFGCRHCYRLTYHSRQSHNKRFDVLNRLYKRMEAGDEDLDLLAAAESALFR